MLKKLSTISSELKFKNPYWEYKLDRYAMPDGNTADYHYVNSRGSTIIIPQIDDNIFILIRQYRYLNKQTSIEFPGGGVKEGYSPLENANEELLEETGYKSEEMLLIGEYNPFNGVTNEICSVFLAKKLTQQAAQPDASEEFEIIELTKDEIINKIKKGEIWDGMTLAAWSLFYFSGSNSK